MKNKTLFKLLVCIVVVAILIPTIIPLTVVKADEVLFGYEEFRDGDNPNWLGNEIRKQLRTGGPWTQAQLNRVEAINLYRNRDKNTGIISSGEVNVNSPLIGKIPESIINLKNLKTLNLRANQLVGKIPELPNSVQFVALDYNKLTGELPNLKGATNLSVLKIEDNQLVGTVTDKTNTLTFLQFGRNFMEEKHNGTDYQNTMPNQTLEMEVNDVLDVNTIYKYYKKYSPSDENFYDWSETIEWNNPTTTNSGVVSVSGANITAKAVGTATVTLKLKGSGASGNSHNSLNLNVTVNAATGTKGKANITILDGANSEPLKNSVVNLYRNNTLISSAVTNSAGKAIFNNVEVGISDYRVSAEKEGYVAKPWNALSVLSTAGSTVSNTVYLNSNKYTGKADITILNGANSAPLNGVKVTLYKGGTLVTTSTTGSDGVATFSNIENVENYNVKIEKDGFGTKEGMNLGKISAVGSPFTYTNTFYMGEAKGKATITVKDNENAVLSGAKVTLYNGSTTYGSANTNASGVVVLDNLQSNINYSVKVEKSGYATETSVLGTITTSGQELSKTVNLTPFTGSNIITVKNPDGSVLSGAKVTLFENGTQISDSYFENSTGITDASGKVKAEGLKSNKTYTISVSKDGYVTQENVVLTAITASGQSHSNVVVTLPADAAIIGSTTVKVTYDGSKLLEGATVTIYKGSNPIGSAITDSTGKATIGNLQATYAYTATVEKVGFATREYVTIPVITTLGENVIANAYLNYFTASANITIKDKTNNNIEGATVKVFENDIEKDTFTTNNLGQISITGMRGDKEYKVTVSKDDYITQENIILDSITSNGQVMNKTIMLDEVIKGKATITVKDIDGSILAGVDVTIFNGSTAVDTVTTNGSGIATINNLLTGITYTVKAEKAGYVTKENIHVTGNIVNMGDIVTAEITLNPYVGFNVVTVKDIDGKAIANANITILEDNISIGANKTNASGQIIIEDMRSDKEYKITVSHDNFVIQENILLDSITSNNQQNVKNIVLSEYTGQAKLTILNSISDVAVSDAIVKLYKNNTFVSTLTTDGDGTVTFNNIKSNITNYRISVEKPGYESKDWLDLDGFLSDATTSNFVYEKDFKLAPYVGSAKLTIQDTSGDTAIEEATVKIFENDVEKKEVKTNALGEITIENMRSDIIYKVTVSKAGYTTKEKVTLDNITTNGETLSKTIKLDQVAKGKAVITVVDKDDNPLTGVTVTIYDNKTVMGTETSVDGVAIINNLPTGITYTVKAEKTGYITKEGIAVVGNIVNMGDEVTAKVYLNPNVGSTAVTVEDTAGVAITGAKVEIFENDIKINEIDTNATGKVTISDMRADRTYKVTITKEGYTTQEEIALDNITTNGESLNKTIKLDQIVRGKATVTVKDKEGKIMPGATVTIYNGATAVDAGTTDAEGKTTINNLPTGITYTVKAEKAGYVTKEGIAVVGSIVNVGDVVTAEVFLNPNVGSTVVTVEDTAGVAITGAKVEIFENDIKINEIDTNATGKVTISDMRADRTYKVTITKEGYTAQEEITLDNITTNGETKNKTIKINQEAAATITGEATITIVDKGGEPISGAVVTIYSGSTSLGSGQTNAEGKILFKGLEANTIYTITITKDGYTTQTNITLEEIIADGQKVNENITLEKESVISTITGKAIITIVDVNGNPISGASVIIYNDKDVFGGGKTNSEGKYVIEDLKDKIVYAASVSKDGYIDQEKVVLEEITETNTVVNKTITLSVNTNPDKDKDKDKDTNTDSNKSEEKLNNGYVEKNNSSSNTNDDGPKVLPKAGRRSIVYIGIAGLLIIILMISSKKIGLIYKKHKK